MIDSTQAAFDRIADALGARRKPQPSYFVVMIDYCAAGREAVVNPDLTRADIVARIKSGEFKQIDFIHHIVDGLAEDVTADLIDEAEGELKVEAMNRSERIANTQDHNRKLRAEAA
jgi:phosphoglucomutase